MCVKLRNKWVNFIFLCKLCEETHCFLEKLTQLEKFYTTAGRDGRDKQDQVNNADSAIIFLINH